VNHKGWGYHPDVETVIWLTSVRTNDKRELTFSLSTLEPGNHSTPAEAISNINTHFGVSERKTAAPDRTTQRDQVESGESDPTIGAALTSDEIEKDAL
jgi:hypothetical protein